MQRVNGSIWHLSARHVFAEIHGEEVGQIFLHPGSQLRTCDHLATRSRDFHERIPPIEGSLVSDESLDNETARISGCFWSHYAMMARETPIGFQ